MYELPLTTDSRAQTMQLQVRIKRTFHPNAIHPPDEPAPVPPGLEGVDMGATPPQRDDDSDLGSLLTFLDGPTGRTPHAMFSFKHDDHGRVRFGSFATTEPKNHDALKTHWMAFQSLLRAAGALPDEVHLSCNRDGCPAGGTAPVDIKQASRVKHFLDDAHTCPGRRSKTHRLEVTPVSPESTSVEPPARAPVARQ